MKKKTSNLSVTVDIEDWYNIPSVCGSPFSVYKDVEDFFKKWSNRYDYLTEPTKRVLKLLDEFDITATFFIVADVVERYPGMVEEIVENGHEVGCHGLDHSCKIHPKTKKPLMGIKEFEQRTLKAKNLLEKKYHGKVVGYRAPNALVSGWMLDSLEKLGFNYDSSVCVNSLYNKTDSSLDGVSTYPYYPQKGRLDIGGNRSLIEFPWAYYSICGFKVPASGGPFLRFLGANFILQGLRQSLKRGPTVFYFHPLDISDDGFPEVGRGRPLYWSIKGELIERRIRKILSNMINVDKRCLGEMATENFG